MKKEYVLLAFIVLLSIVYYKGNFKKITYVHNKIVKPLLAGSSSTQSNIVRVSISSPTYSVKKSFVKDALVTPLGRYLIFLKVPSNVSLENVADYIAINGEKVQGQPVDQHILFATQGAVRTYIINDFYDEHMLEIIRLEGLGKSSTQP